MAVRSTMDPVDGRCWCRRQGVHYRPLVEGGILYDEEGGQVHHLNGTAALVWESCQEGATLGQLVACVCAAYEASPVQVTEDVAAALRQLERAGVLR